MGVAVRVRCMGPEGVSSTSRGSKMAHIVPDIAFRMMQRWRATAGYVSRRGLFSGGTGLHSESHGGGGGMRCPRQYRLGLREKRLGYVISADKYGY